MALTKKEGNITVHLSPWQVEDEDFFRGNIADYMLSSPHWDKDPHKPILIDALDSKNRLSAADIKSKLGKLTYVLRETYGINEGEPVCLLLRNSIHIPLLHFAILATGGIVSPANIVYLPNELHHQLHLSQAKLVITTDEFKETVVRATKEFGPVAVQHIVTLDKLWKQMEQATGTLAPVKFSGEEGKTRPAYYCFSSGTSGVAKGVFTSHHNVISNVTQQILSSHETMYKPDTVFAAVLPMSHIYGLSIFVYVLPFLGNTSVVFPKYDFKQFLERISEHGISLLHIVPPMAVEFAKNPIVENYPLVKQHVKGIMCGAAPLSKSLGDGLIARLGCKIWQAYGMTEASPMCHLATFDSNVYNRESVGWLLAGLEARLVDDQGQDVHDFNSPGELWLRGPNVMQGYIKNPAANAEAFADPTASCGRPWFRTGDVAIVDETGQWYIVDRFKELIKSKGHQVAPAELESILLSHPDVADAAVTGIHLPEEGTELPRAFVVLRNNAEPLAIKQWFDSRVSKHKRLWGGLVVIDAVPKSPAGKIQRRLLRNRVGDVPVGYRSSNAKL